MKRRSEAQGRSILVDGPSLGVGLTEVGVVICQFCGVVPGNPIAVHPAYRGRSLERLLGLFGPTQLVEDDTPVNVGFVIPGVQFRGPVERFEGLLRTARQM